MSLLSDAKLSVLYSDQGFPAGGACARAVGHSAEGADKAQRIIRIETDEGFI